MRICFPTSNLEGLESEVYGHFGSAPHDPVKWRLNMNIRLLLSATLIAVLISSVWTIPSTMADQLEDAELTSIVKKAYVYSFPVYEMYRLRQGAV